MASLECYDLLPIPNDCQVTASSAISDESNLPADFEVPSPHDSDDLTETEDPLEDEPEPALEMDLPEHLEDEAQSG